MLLKEEIKFIPLPLMACHSKSSLLKKNKNNIERFLNEIDDLSDNIFYFIKNLEDPSVEASNFYLSIVRLSSRYDSVFRVCF